MALTTNKTKIIHDSNYIFLGNEEFGIPVLKALLETRAKNFSYIYTSEKLKDKYLNLVKQYNIPVIGVKKINEHFEEIKVTNPTALLVCGWSQLIKEDFLNSFPCIGMHPTLLPERRGRCPITWTLIDGLKESGVTIFYLDKGVDSGDIIFQRKFTIDSRDIAQDLINKVNRLLIEMFSELLENFPEVPREKQDESLATYKELRREEDDEIDLDWSLDEIDRFIRAHTSPYPLAYVKNITGDKIYIKEVIIEK